MTDLERFKALLDDFGIHWVEPSGGDSKRVDVIEIEMPDDKPWFNFLDGKFVGVD